MIKIQSIVREIVLEESEASYSLSNGFMNMSGYAKRIKTEVEKRAKKSVTRTSLVVALTRVRSELKKISTITPKVIINNITTKLPITEIVYENTDMTMTKLESLHKKIQIPREDLFTATVGTGEITIICSSHNIEKIKKHFCVKPKIVASGLSAVSVAFDSKYFKIPNVIFSLVFVLARAKVNIAEIVSTYTELIFIISEKDHSKTVSLLSQLAKPK